MSLVERVENRKYYGGTEKYLLNKETNEKYSRIVGGLAWPGVQPGYAVVLGEHLEEDKNLKKRPIRLLWEYESHDLQDLFRRCSEASGHFSADPFYTDDKNEPMVAALRKSGVHLYINSAPFVDDSYAFSTYLLTIRQLTVPGKKLLRLGKTSLLPVALMNMTPDSIPTSSAEAFRKFPSVTALCFAVMALETLVYNPREDAEVEEANQELYLREM
jgi:hypothetical protein